MIDCGLARVPRYEPDVGLTRLETVRVSRAAADQRRGRAGRTEPGVCYRLWDEPQTASLEAYARPEILSADLSAFVLDLAQWGAADPGKLAFLDPPPAAALTEARALLAELGAHRRGAAASPTRAASCAACRCRRGSPAWWSMRRREGAGAARRRDRRGPDRARARRRRRRSRAIGSISFAATARAAARMRGAMAKRWADDAGGKSAETIRSVGRRASCALAYPDRIAKSRGAEAARSCSPTAAAPTSIRPRRWRASHFSRSPSSPAPPRRAASCSRRRSRSPRSRRASPIGSSAATTITLRRGVGEPARPRAATASARSRSPSGRARSTPERGDRATCSPKASSRLGLDRLPWTKALQQWRDRVMFLRRAEGDEWPDLSDAALAASAADWLAPLLDGKTALSAVSRRRACRRAIGALLPWTLQRRLDAEAPTHFTAPSGSSVPIDYDAEEGPTLSIRVQELFGLDRHPSIAGGKRAAGGRAAVAGAPAGAGDARSAGLLARLLRGGEGRDARPLSAPSLAGRSADGAGHPPRQAARHLIVKI